MNELKLQINFNQTIYNNQKVYRIEDTDLSEFFDFLRKHRNISSDIQNHKEIYYNPQYRSTMWNILLNIKCSNKIKTIESSIPDIDNDIERGRYKELSTQAYQEKVRLLLYNYIYTNPKESYKQCILDLAYIIVYVYNNPEEELDALCILI
ncbi:hypothetical protein WA158_002931 [Blastocystis sp. Blastoise]